RALVEALDGAPFTVTAVEEKPYRSSPKPPFITSTLQQEGGRKLGMTSRQVMSTAQSLYEKGYITYMRTDSVTLSEEALSAARTQARELYGDRYLPDAPRVYRGKVKNAQEAHEAIRPAGDRWRTPEQLAGELTGPELRLYELIWKRTLASQMADAVGKTVSVRIEAPVARRPEGLEVTTTHWSASGRTITFPGYLRVYVEGSDDPDAELDDRERLLPELEEGQRLPDPTIEPQGHTTQPPPRYTEASLVKRLEELGIGRPSTYASIMQTIQDRGYVRKRGQALVPTWSAFAVVQLLEAHFTSEVDYSFTARMEDLLDEIAAGRREREPFLHDFWFGRNGNGDGVTGLTALIEAAMANADPAQVNSIPIGKDPDGNEIVVRNGRYGPYVKRGEDTASVPEDLAPDELTVEKALELLSAPKGDEPIGPDPETGLPVYAQSGRFGPYVQPGDADTLPAGAKPRTASRFKSMSLSPIALEDPLRELGDDPVTGRPMVGKSGRYGPYVTDGETNASLREREGDTVEGLTPERAAELLQMRREAGPAKKRGTRKKAAAKKAAKKTASKSTRKAPAKKTSTKKTSTRKAAARKAASGNGRSPDADGADGSS